MQFISVTTEQQWGWQPDAQSRRQCAWVGLRRRGGWRRERDLRVLRNVWEASCDSAREEFQSTLPGIVSLKHRLSELEGELKELRFNCKCGVAEPPDLTPTVAAVTVNDGLDIRAFLRRC
jgi:hypothetical protein